MRRWATSILVILAGCAPGDPSVTNLEFVPEMVDAVPYEAFSQNPVTRDGKTLMTPPKGTIPRGFQPFHYGPGLDEAARAGREVVNPVAETKESLARGERVFRAFCVPCHGAAGLGDGPVVPRFPGPPSLLDKRATSLPDGQIFHIISRGQGLMPSHASQIDAEDRWKAVLYIRSLQKAGKGGAK